MSAKNVEHKFIVPNSVEVRDYQVNLANQAKNENCLIILPTGLGKTVVALHVIADYLTKGNETRLLVITPETDALFSFSGDFEILDVIVANSQYEVSVELPLAASFSLSDAYPNPFNPTTTMTLVMPVSGDITVEVYNLLGQVVATLTSGYMEANTSTKLTWDASDVSSGMYFVKAQADGFTATQKLMLVK